MSKKVVRKSKLSRPAKQSTQERLSLLWPKRPAFLLPLLASLVVLVVASYITGTQKEEHDNFCASCHTQPEETFYTRSLQSTPTDLATYHAKKGVLCIQCHAGKGLIGRSLGLMAGAQDLVAFYSGNYPKPIKMEEPLPDANCTRCHASVLTNQDFNNHYHSLLSQWRSVDPQNAAVCITCHTSHSTTGAVADMFLIQNPTVQVCQKCHAIAGEG
jgi:hypothetical protein